MPDPIHVAEISAFFRTPAERDGPTGAFSVIDWGGVVDPGALRYQVVAQGEAEDNYATLCEAHRAAEALAVAFDVNRLMRGGVPAEALIQLWDETCHVVRRHLGPTAFQSALMAGGGLSVEEATALVMSLHDRPDAAVLGLSNREYDAALAGLRLLARELAAGRVTPDDNDIGTILTCDRQHPGLTAEQMHALADAWQAGERSIAR